MNVAIITGSGGLIGSEAVKFLSDKFDKIVGIDNDMRAYFFGNESSTKWNSNSLEANISNFHQENVDIRDFSQLEDIFQIYQNDIKLVLHTAAQPSHDWAAKEPFTDFSVNANGTLNLLEVTRKYCPNAVFIFTSTNKVYGDTPNMLPLEPTNHRFILDSTHPYSQYGIDESMSIDQTKHSLFGASKAAADIMVQEYGRYFGMYTGIFRGGCLTGPNHSGTQLHGFLAYLMKCSITKTEYTVFGYDGLQVRDNIHSWDLVNAFWHFYQNPRIAEVYNIGGGIHANCSMREAILLCKDITGVTTNIFKYSDQARIGDHKWWISDVRKFKSHYPEWEYKYDLKSTLIEMYDEMKKRY